MKKERKIMKRVVILTELFFPEETSTGYFLTKIAEGLAREYEVKVITGPATQSFVLCTDFPKYEIRNQVEIIRCLGSNFDKNLLLGRLINLFTRSLTIFLKALVVCNRKEIILVVTNPPSMPFVALLLKWIKSCQFILIIHDIYPEILFVTEMVKPSSPVVKIGQFINQVIYKNAVRIITLGRDMAHLAKSKLKYKDKLKVCCIPLWSDLDLIQPQNKADNKILKDLGLSESFVVLYAGNIGRTHGIEDIAESAKNLAGNTKIHFLISGFGAKKQWLQEYVISHQLKNITILDPCHRSQLMTLLNACDVALIAFLPGMAGVSVPSRMYNQMAAGKPIICVTEDWSELAEVVHEEAIGWVVHPGNIEELVNTIRFAAQYPEVCRQMGLKAAVVAQSTYTFTQTDKAYKELLQEIFSKHHTQPDKNQ